MSIYVFVVSVIISTHVVYGSMYVWRVRCGVEYRVKLGLNVCLVWGCVEDNEARK